jgi:hypothetical protein
MEPLKVDHIPFFLSPTGGKMFDIDSVLEKNL